MTETPYIKIGFTFVQTCKLSHKALQKLQVIEFIGLCAACEASRQLNISQISETHAEPEVKGRDPRSSNNARFLVRCWNAGKFLIHYKSIDAEMYRCTTFI